LRILDVLGADPHEIIAQIVRKPHKGRKRVKS
jgi:hypothetical protein